MLINTHDNFYGCSACTLRHFANATTSKPVRFTSFFLAQWATHSLLIINRIALLHLLTIQESISVTVKAFLVCVFDRLASQKYCTFDVI